MQGLLNKFVMLAIRLECDDGDGIFVKREKGFDLGSLLLGDRIIKAHKNFPTPITEFGDHFTEDHRCAYKSIDQLLQWISLRDLEYLQKFGVVIYQLELDFCLEGEFQICYLEKNIINKKKILINGF